MNRAALDRYLDWLQALDAASLGEISRHCAEGVRFCDPFHDVVGSDAYARVLAQALRDVKDLEFRVEQVAETADGALLAWTFAGALPGGRRAFRGMSVVRLDAAGLVCEHRDYWDSAAVFEGVPLIGRLLGWAKRRVAARSGRP